jgi:hypothetical protein
MMRSRLMRLVKRVGSSELLLMMCKLPLLLGRQDAEFLLLDIRDLVRLHGREIVVVLQAWEGAFFAETPS